MCGKGVTRDRECVCLVFGDWLSCAHRTQVHTDLPGVVEALGVTHALLTPAVWSLVDATDSVTRRRMTTLRRVALGGEAMSGRIIASWGVAGGGDGGTGDSADVVEAEDDDDDDDEEEAEVVEASDPELDHGGKSHDGRPETAQPRGKQQQQQQQLSLIHI